MGGFFFIFVVILIVIPVVVVPLAIAQSRKTNLAWSTAARQLGLRMQPGALFKSRNISGSLHGFGVVVDTFTRSSGKHSTTYTRFRISYPRTLGLGLRLTREGFFSGVGKFFGAQDIEVGDRQFDGDVLVKGTLPGRVKGFLTPARRMRIHRLLMSHDGAVIDDGGISWSTRGVLRDSGRIVNTVKRFIRVAWFLTGDRKADAEIERAIGAQDRGQPGEALAILGERLQRRERGARRRRVPEPRPAELPVAGESRETPAAPEPPPLPARPPEEQAPPPVPVPAAGGEDDEPEGEPLEEKVLQGELLYLAGRRGEARETFEDALREAPEDPEIRQWAERSRATAETAAAPAAAAATEAAAGLDVREVCEALFDARNSSFDANRTFEERFDGKPVTWSGELRSVDSYSFDFVFGDEPGLKAVLQIHEMPTIISSDNKVLAVVQLPQEAQDTLKEKIGKSITIEGRLKKVDGLMRNIYIAAGNLR